MSDRPARPILRLKNPPKPPPAPPAAPSWKCKPCGALLAPAEAADEAGVVRCPKCTAKLGALDDFTADPPRAEKVRARPVKGRA